jgi:quinol monooxygenase YgiN
MVIEIARIQVKPGTEEQFKSAVRDGLEVLRRQPVHHRSWIAQGVEQPDVFTLYVEWNSLEEKMAFRNGPEFPEWRKHITEFLAEPPQAQHWNLVET